MVKVPPRTMLCSIINSVMELGMMENLAVVRLTVAQLLFVNGINTRWFNMLFVSVDDFFEKANLCTALSREELYYAREMNKGSADARE